MCVSVGAVALSALSNSRVHRRRFIILHFIGKVFCYHDQMNLDVGVTN